MKVLNITKKIVKKSINLLKQPYYKQKVKYNTKYFCIGRNKTGTTSLGKAFESLGFIVGNQLNAEKLYDKYFFEDDFEKIIDYCKTAEVFQDVPFSYFKIVPHIDKAYPGSKFILTIRNDADQWYNSITRFHAKKFGKKGAIPTYEDLENAEYVRKGFMTRTVDSHGTSIDNPYNKEIMTAHYQKHNQDVLDYFKDRPEDLLVINLAEKGAYQKFCKFIGVECSDSDDFPWENKT